MATGDHFSNDGNATTHVFAAEKFAEAALHSEMSLEVEEGASPASSRPLGGSQRVAAAELPQAESNGAEYCVQDKEPVPYASNVGAIRGFVAVLGIYVVLAMLGFGGFLLWSWLH